MQVPSNLKAEFHIAQISYQKNVSIEVAAEEHNGKFLTFINDCAKWINKDYDLFKNQAEGAEKLKTTLTAAFNGEDKKIHHSKATATNFSPNFKLSDERGSEFTFRFIEKGNTITLQKALYTPGQKYFNWEDIFSQESTFTLDDLKTAVESEETIKSSPNSYSDYRNAMTVFQN